MSIRDTSKMYKPIFINDVQISDLLAEMELDPLYRTDPGYENSAIPTKLLSFSERHLNYLHSHPKVNPEHYLSNLRAMTKIRPS